MGYYTELVLAVEFKTLTPSEVYQVIEAMIAMKTDGLLTPDHPFFSAERWSSLLVMDSYYFPGDAHSVLRHDEINGEYYLTTRSNLKNYDGEIEKFLDWIAPYVRPRGYAGYRRAEDDDLPTLIVFDANEGLKYLRIPFAMRVATSE